MGNAVNLPLELELKVINILSKHYPHYRFKLTVEIEHGLLIINFLGCFTENSDFHRNNKIDFRLFWGNHHLALSGWWRNAILSFEFTPMMQEWLNEDGEKIPRPYPDGEEFEAIATSLYPLLQKYFPV